MRRQRRRAPQIPFVLCALLSRAAASSPHRCDAWCTTAESDESPDFTTPVEIEVLGDLQRYQDFKATPMMNSSSATVRSLMRPSAGAADGFPNGTVHLHSDASPWRHAMRHGASWLDVVVFGSSSSNGCGALAPKIACMVKESWVRHLAQSLQHLLRGSHLTPRAAAQIKNAVSPGYYSLCTASFIPRNTSVVILEFEPTYASIWHSPDRADLGRLLEIIRLIAPHAAIIFAGWPVLRVVSDMLRGQQIPDEKSLVEVTATQRADTVLASGMLMATGIHDVNQIKQAFYADGIHGSAAAHAMLGELVARHIVRRLRAHGCGGSSHPGDGDGDDSDIRPHRTAASQHEPERCYTSAEQLPVASADEDWKLVDEGGAKGIKKTGYVSHVVGGTLTLEALPPGSCGAASASLSYLRSWRPDQGAFSISCSGCSCRECVARRGSSTDCVRQSAFESFPVVQTSSVRTPVIKRMVCSKGDAGDCQTEPADCVVASDSSQAQHACTSVSVLSRFWLEKANESTSCRIHVTHGVFPPNSPLNQSRVRIDSMSIGALNPMKGCAWKERPHSRDNDGAEIRGAKERLVRFACHNKQ